ncbi:hypothetical protein [Sedimenticola sp.]|uniref:hypothetical protein n=1 Tax=Sedimenticola sp. TaxID=1940285 RepID=UPI002590E3C8|nr:hypothetical protein [Sedimenticola sp.]MCW8902777.1 hypothetical protein [Sedimenticola sp.]
MKQLHQRAAEKLAGLILFLMALLSILHGLYGNLPAYLAGGAGWLAALLLANSTNTVQRIQVIAMLLVGGSGLLWGTLSGAAIPFEKVFSTNQAMLAMLASVSFLRLVTQPAICDEALPQGNRPLWRTLFGVHFLGTVINMSSIVIIGDRLSANRAMTPLQACVLSRGFAMAACWSPFFAAMGIALSNAPGSQLTTLSTVGFPVAMLALLLTGWELTRNSRADSFHGYPMQFSALWIPALLALMLMLLHHTWPNIPILTLISTLSLSVTLLLLLLRHGRAGLGAYRQHIRVGLPRMSGELLLFLAAGVLATGIASAIQASNLSVDLQTFGATEASLLLLAMVSVSVIGIHPVISIATAGGILSPLGVDPNLLAITFLMTWAIGVSTTPFSGLHLTIQGRYHINAFTLLRMNAGFALVMLGVATLALHLYTGV